ncbi:TPA: hypothetical protein N0F65_003400, partial [Lagenidium giganteum]
KMVNAQVVIAAALAMAVGNTAAFRVTFKNSCDYPIDLNTRLAFNYGDKAERIPQGGSCSREIGKGYEGHFRHGEDDAATLIEFSTKGDMDIAWFDLSVIPPHLKPGHEFCSSLADCKQWSEKGHGFNVPVQVTPLSNTNGKQCRELTCLADGCEDAYLFPKDDTKTHACPMNTDFTVTFCPGGSPGPYTDAPLPSPTTQAPAPTTQAPAPTTQAPAPTTQAPVPTTQAPVPSSQAPVPTSQAPAPYTDRPGPQPNTSAPYTPAPTKAPVTQAPVPSSAAPQPQPSSAMPKPVAPTPYPSTTVPQPATSVPASVRPYDGDKNKGKKDMCA